MRIALEFFMKTFIRTVPCLVLAACGASADDAASSAESGESALLATAQWEKVYRCDDGTTLDVNVKERREIQFVVRGKAAIDYLTTALPDPYAGSVKPNAKGELIFQGGVFNYGKPGANPPPKGIFHPWDFSLGYGTAGNLPARIAGGYGEIRIFLEIPYEERPLDATPMPSNWIFRNCR
jgi:hypothetical protein